MKYVYVGRFQPFHNGHVGVINNYLHRFLEEYGWADKVKHLKDDLIIFIGSSNVKDERNPYTYEQRKEFIETVYGPETLRIYPLPDIHDDKRWMKQIADVLLKEDNYAMHPHTVTFLAGSRNDLCEEQLKYITYICDRRINNEHTSGTKVREILNDATISLDKKRETLLDYMPKCIINKVLNLLPMENTNMSTDFSTAVQDAVDVFIDDESCFSSLNIKNYMFRCGAFDSLSNITDEVKQLFKDGYMEKYGYTRTPCSFDDVHFYVYHSVGINKADVEANFEEDGLEDDLEVAYLTYLENKDCGCEDVGCCKDCVNEDD